MYYNFTFKKTIKLPRFIALIMATIISSLLPPLIRSSRSIPVYRGTKKIMETFNLSIDILNKGEQVMIFPDIDYDDASNLIGEIHTGFTHLEKLYFRANKEHIGFVPIVFDKTNKIISNANILYFNDDRSYESGKEILVNEIIGSINLNHSKNIRSNYKTLYSKS